MSAADDTVADTATLAPGKHAHATAVAWVRLAIGNDPDFRLFPNNTGLAKHTRKDDSETAIKYGLANGGADTVGILGPYGRWVALEIKIADDPVRPKQELFLALIRKFGGYAAVLRFPHGSTQTHVTAQAHAELNRARKREGNLQWTHYEADRAGAAP